MGPTIKSRRNFTDLKVKTQSDSPTATKFQENNRKRIRWPEAGIGHWALGIGKDFKRYKTYFCLKNLPVTSGLRPGAF
jgi:hypothetical protein